MSREISCFWRERERLNIDQVHVPGNKLLLERERERLNIDQVHVPGNKLLLEREREREAEHRPGTCPGK